MADEIMRDIFIKDRWLPVQIDYVQGTNAVPLKFQFRDYAIPSGAAARIYVKKPSGKEVYNSASLSGNTVTVQPTTQMFAEAGEQEGQLQLTSGQKILVTFPILFRVERNLISESAVESTDEYGVLLQLIGEAEKAVVSAKDAAGKASTAAGKAESAAEAAGSAGTKAEKAAEAANTAAGSASSAAAGASQAAEKADAAAEEASAAAKRANEAAQNVEGLEVTDLVNRIKEMEEQMKQVTLLMYPVGSVYESTDITNPREYFGGTWEVFGAGRVTVGIDTGQTEFNQVRKTGGAKTQTLTQAQLPKITGKVEAGSGNSGTADGGYGAFRKASGVFSVSPEDYQYSMPKRENAMSWPSGYGKYYFEMSVGENQPHDNMPPYVTVYRWVRTA